MYKFILTLAAISLISLAIFLPVSPAMAQGSGIPSTVRIPTANDLGIEASPITSHQGVTDTIIFFVKLFYTLFFILTVIFVLLAAYKYLTAAGDAEHPRES